MVDKMMRIAGRTEDGKAKAIESTENSGIKTVQNAEKRYLFTSNFELLAGAEQSTMMLTNNGYNYGQLTVSVTSPRMVEVYIQEFAIVSDTSISDERRLVYTAEKRRYNHIIDFPIFGENYVITIKNIDTVGTTVRRNSYELLFVNPIHKEEEEGVEVEAFSERSWLDSGVALNAGESYETEVMEFDGRPYSKAVVTLSTPRRIRVSLKVVPSQTFPERSDYEIIYESDARLHNHNFDFETINDYQIKIENIDTVGTDITRITKELRFEDGGSGKDVTVNVVANDEVYDITPVTSLLEKTAQKVPDSHLVFKKSAVKTSQINLCDDGLFYALESNVIKRYKSIDDAPELVDSGITWDREALGRIHRFVAFPDGGVTVFTDDTTTAFIYHMDTINSTPELVYQSETSTPSYWSGRNGFGIKSYYNGLNGYILAGVYGAGESKKDLLFSNDYGKTFQVVKQSTNIGGNRSHWHDVAFDTYSGWLWAAEGDESIGNQNVFASWDWGENWRLIPSTGRDQPTAIMPFADRVVFGRDSKIPGLDVYRKPLSGVHTENSIEVLQEYKIDTSSYKMYGHSPVMRGKEAYLTHNLYPETNPNLILGTGDGGKSYHAVFSAINNDDLNITSLFGMDDKYIYGHGNPANQDLWYAEKPNWESW